jgi:hypothetical protein
VDPERKLGFGGLTWMRKMKIKNRAVPDSFNSQLKQFMKSRIENSLNICFDFCPVKFFWLALLNKGWEGAGARSKFVSGWLEPELNEYYATPQH